MALRRRRGTAPARQAFLHDPDLLRNSPAPPTTRLDNIHTANKATVSIHIHKDSELPCR